LRPGVVEDARVGGVEVVEAALVQPLEHVPLHRLPGHAEERADQRRPERLTRLPVAAPATAQLILAVELRSSDGRSWSAIGGGDTVAAALDWARECCPDDTSWELLGREELYGD
jgi:hypothetical protein